MLRQLVQEQGTILSLALVAVILGFAAAGHIYIRKREQEDNALEHRGFIEMIPSLVSTLGVLGTFAGITLGLVFFDTRNLPQSIPLLLNGLKTAFFTSLAGMIGSLVLSSKVNKLFDKKTGGVSDSAEAAGMVVKALETMQKQSEEQTKTQNLFYNTIQQLVQAVETHTNSLSDNISKMSVAVASLSLDVTSIRDSQQAVDEKMGHLLPTVGNIEETNKSMLSNVEAQNSRLGEITDHTDALVSGQAEISTHVAKFGEVLHGEILEIEDKMTETNRLLVEKFDEFSELLKKSNTEALVEVMKKVTEEFQKQMNELINKLIQENFEQLNNSVERLNTWQQENKEMIQRLTMQYHQMADNFEQTSTSLAQVDEDTRQLVSEGGRLHQIVAALNKVIVEDEKFIKISNDLQSTTALTKSNFEQFDASTKALNDWVKKQRNFVDSVVVLIQKLEEIGKIKDYGEEFWQGTRKQMDEGVGIIKGGTEALNKQVAGLNSQFYARLSSTLTELDNCITALVEKAERQ